MGDEHAANPFRRWSARTESDAEPGWYTDPTGIYSERYWDGTTWTDEVVDRNRTTSTHRTTRQHAPPSSEASSPRVAAAMSSASARSAAADRSSQGASDPYAVSVMESLIDDDRARAQPGEDVLALTAQILQRASERAGMDWDGAGMTIDGVVDALPADFAEATVRAIHALYEPSGDDDNARWTEAKLVEIRARRTARRHLQPVADLPVTERPATERTDATWLRNLEPSPPVETPKTPPLASVAPSSEARAHAEPSPAPAPAPTVPAGDVVSPDSREAGEHRGSAKSLAARIRSMRNLWVIGTVVFVVLTAGYLLLPVNETSTSVDGTQTVHLSCGSVVSPHATTTRGTELKSASSLCAAARQPNESRATFFGFLALVNVALAGFAMTSESQSFSTTKSQPTSAEGDPPGVQ